MYISQFLILFELQFLDSLVELDRVNAQAMREKGCELCGGKLDCAHYERRPRGVKVLNRSHKRRLSFCCRDCRRRCTPASILFLGRKVYLSIVVVLMSYLRDGRERVLVRKLSGLSGASEATIRRWLGWWDGAVSRSDFWKMERSRFIPPLADGHLIVSMVERFRGSCKELSASFGNLLKFLSPLSIPTQYPC